MKHLKLFETNAAYEAAKPSIPYSDTPYIAAIEEDGGVNFVPKTIYESDLSIGPWVDLGLPSGKMWASYNLGATRPCEYGDYYQWAATTPATSTACNESTCPYTTDGKEYTKYNKTDGKTELDASDDAIYQSTDGKAKIPSKAEFEELLANTTHEWVLCSKGLGHEHENPVYGELFTGKNGGKIFIPASGRRFGGSFYYQGSYGIVWSSSVYSGLVDYAWRLYFDSSTCGVSNGSRYDGRCLRGVKNSI